MRAVATCLGALAAAYVLAAIAAWDPFWLTPSGLKTGVRVVAGCALFTGLIMAPLYLASRER